MKLGLRGRLFVTSLTLIGVVGVAAGLWLQSALRDIVTTQLQYRLTHATAMTRVALSELPPGADVPTVDRLADRLGQAAKARITIVAADGSLLGDSSLNLKRLRAADSHLTRPEIHDARRNGLGVSTRYSTTLGVPMLYVAARGLGGEGFVRAAVPLSSLDEPVDQFRLQLLPMAGLGLLVAIIMAGLASQLIARPLSALVKRTRDLADQVGRESTTSHDELGYVAGSLERFAKQLGNNMTALAAERDRLDAVLSSMGEGVVALDDDLRVRIVNPAAHKMLGIEGEAEDRMLVELARAPGLIELAHRALREPCADELKLGDKRTVAVSGTPLRATGGCLLVLHDVTEVRRLEQVRRDFVANISHELRTPVSVIRANSETLLDGAIDDPKQGRVFAAASLRHAERLSNLLSDLLDLARLESDAYGIKLQVLPLRTTLSAALASIRPLAEKKGIELRFDAPPRVSVLGDPQALDQVLVNLLENAVKYTQEGGAVSLRAVMLDGNEARIEVRDNGPGVSREHRDRIFERFYRVDAGRSREVGGTGLGLSIVKHLVAAMRGQVGLDPNEPSGSCFWFTLQVRETDAQADDEDGTDDGEDCDAVTPGSAA